MKDNEILQQLPCSIMILTEEGKVDYINQRMELLSGYAIDELKGRSLSENPLFSSGRDIADNCVIEKMSRSGDVIINSKLFLINSNKALIPVYISGRWGVIADRGRRACFTITDTSRFEDCTTSGGNDKGKRTHLYNLVGKDTRMQEIYDLIEMTAATNVNVVVQGESGTGKELIAAAIHRNSDRADKPFVRVNCSALTESLLESELFGHVKGSFTGAFKDRKGRFEEAEGGTIFLDEIGEISPAIQVKLLHVLQERVITRVGDNREIKVDVRVISATNRNLRARVAKNKFREDLFYRLNVFPINAPSLKDRKNDIGLLCDFFLEKFRSSTTKPIYRISSDAMRILIGYCWPGNVRELENAIEHSFVLCQGNTIEPMDLPHEIRVAALREGICKGKEYSSIPQIEIAPAVSHKRKQGGRLNISRAELIRELELHSQSRAATARDLGISTVALWKKMKKFGIS